MGYLAGIFLIFLSFCSIESVYAAGTAVQLDFLDNLGATIKEMLKGTGTLVIDAMMLVGGGWGAARMGSPAPLISALVGVIMFEVITRLLII